MVANPHKLFDHLLKDHAFTIASNYLIPNATFESWGPVIDGSGALVTMSAEKYFAMLRAEVGKMWALTPRSLSERLSAAWSLCHMIRGAAERAFPGQEEAPLALKKNIHAITASVISTVSAARTIQEYFMLPDVDVAEWLSSVCLSLSTTALSQGALRTLPVFFRDHNLKLDKDHELIKHHLRGWTDTKTVMVKNFAKATKVVQKALTLAAGSGLGSSSSALAPAASQRSEPAASASAAGAKRKPDTPLGGASKKVPSDWSKELLRYDPDWVPPGAAKFTVKYRDLQSEKERADRRKATRCSQEKSFGTNKMKAAFEVHQVKGLPFCPAFNSQDGCQGGDDCDRLHLHADCAHAVKSPSEANHEPAACTHGFAP